MHEEKQKEVALHDHSQEWKSLEQQLNIEPITFPEKVWIVTKKRERISNR